MIDIKPELPRLVAEEQPTEEISIEETVENILAEVKEIEAIVAEEKAEQQTGEPANEQPTLRPPSTLQKMVQPQPIDDLTLSVEKIMEEDVGEAYNQLSPIAKQEFKLKGEQVARAIRTMLQTAKITAKKIFELILSWLKMLPGINRFFLEQEAKIKTDRIIILHNERKEKTYATV